MILTNLGRVQDFSYDRPSFIPPTVHVTSYDGAQHVLENEQKYKTMWSEGFSFLMGAGGDRSILSGDSLSHGSQQEYLYGQTSKGDWHSHIKAFYSEITDRLIKEKSYKLAGQNFVDIVRDVGNLGPVHFASRMFNLPLKTKENPKGIYSEHELYAVLSVIFMCIFSEIDPVKSFPMRQAVKAVATQLGKLIEANVKATTGFGIGGLFSWSGKNDPVASYGTNLIKGLSKSGMSNNDITWSQVLPTAGASVPNIAEVVRGPDVVGG